jgi:stage II sporulation protein R
MLSVSVHTGSISGMDGVFMFKLFKTCIFCLLAAFLIWFGTVLNDRQTLNGDVIRFHVVADSDSPEDQAVKLEVKDAIVSYLQEKLEPFTDIDQVKAYLNTHLDALREVAEETLERLGVRQKVSVSFEEEAFPVRHYDTFKLPSGIYQSLRIRIGEAQGKNWWCVVFPSLCLPSTTEDFRDTAVGSGFSENLTDTLEKPYQIRFFLLDWWGRVENFLFRR